MNKLLPIILILYCINSFAQNASVTPQLNHQLNTINNNAYVKINIVFSNQVDFITLNESFKKNNIPVSERAKIVIRKSMQMANKTQQPILQFLNSHSNKVKNYKRFWIINMMTVEAQKSIIEQLLNNPAVDYAEEFSHFTGKPIKIIKGKSDNNKAVGGIEPGLKAINAPALWAMGYTGKARKYFSIDTGVWKDHPAIADAWLGNYEPYSQSWHGIDSPTPVDKDGSHGTHTAGTVLGLDTANNDTIGVAFNAYFMVSDPIVTTAAAIKPLADYIDVFQFALNPDGDTTTTNDIPDAINNSWGISGNSTDTTLCTSYVTQMFNAIQAAGIANVFSAGNEGAAPTTIGQPQYVSTGLVNTFTVGAVNGASSTLPIASFSSRGPTICPVTGSLKIKPEVVAPGVNVRSSVGQNSYAAYNGTSMAGPHATGAVLLLKEAFPNVSGEEILLALYNSAIDLGTVGEDNTYGKGIIDVLAAFDTLSLTHTPTPPNANNYDIVVDKILSPTATIICYKTISPKIIIKNNGDSVINSATITYQLNNEALNTVNWTGILNAGDTTTVTLPPITALNDGGYELKIKASIDTNKIENDYINNQRVFRFNIRKNITTLPYYENFENMKLDSSNWIVLNPDGKTTWDTTTTAGLPNSLHSITMQMYDYLGFGQLDGLISQNFSLPVQDSLFLSFDLAYQMLLTVVADTMTVSVSTDCGNNYTTVYKKGGLNLQTDDTVTTRFRPKYPSHWRTETINLTAYAGNDVMIKFETYNKSGNNLYLDNIWLYHGTLPVAIKEEKSIKKISFYPNPTNHNLIINLGDNNINNATIELFNLVGKSIYKQQVTSQKLKIDLNKYSNGIYLMKFTNQQGSLTYKIIKQ